MSRSSKDFLAIKRCFIQLHSLSLCFLIFLMIDRKCKVVIAFYLRNKRANISKTQEYSCLLSRRKL